MVDQIKQASGTERAAILLLSIGQKRATDILRYMSTQEVQLIGSAMAELRNVTTETVDFVLQDFVSTFHTQTALGIDSENYMRELLTDALGGEKASNILDRIMLGRNGRNIDQLKWMDSRSIANMIRLEHPQIITIVLSLLENNRAAEVLSHLSQEARADIIMRIATLGRVQPAALKEIDVIMEKQLAGNLKSSTIGGIEKAANILNFMERGMDSLVLDEISSDDPDLSRKIQDKMFVFANLADVDDRSVQTLLRDVSTDTLLLALRGADERLKEKFFHNMSKRVSEMLRDDLAMSPPVRLSLVEQAQQDILQVARRLADAGEISLVGGGGDQFI